MKWISHIAVGAAICAVFSPGAVPVAILGATAPDWLERVNTRVRGGRRASHRGATHYLAGWLMLVVFALAVWDWRGLVFWFAIGGVTHWFCDALTVSGVPVGWWSDRRMTIFGGKVITGSASEYMVVCLVVLVCAVFMWAKHSTGGYVPFFIDWKNHYENGAVDGVEWHSHRFDFI